jgi:DNA-binding NarL/FixJ family response regulator
MTVRVLLADDQALVRAGLGTLLRRSRDIAVVAEASTGDEAVREARRHRPDVVLMDIRMPGLDGIAATARIAGDPDLAGVRVIVLTTFETDEYVFAALRAGASGFLTKEVEPEELRRAVRVVASGEALLSPSVTARVITELARRPTTGEARQPTTGETRQPTTGETRQPTTGEARQPTTGETRQPPTGDGPGPKAATHGKRTEPRLEHLTPREVEVVRLIATGRSNEEIAQELFISPLTAKTHVTRAIAKTGVRDRVQLVILAYESGLIRPE